MGYRTRPVAERVADALERLGNAQRRLVQDVATRHGLSPLQVQVLSTLAAGPPPPARASALAREWRVSQPTVSDAVASLVGKGLLMRMPDPADRRASTLETTPAGARLAEQLGAPGEVVAAAVRQLPTDQQEDVLLSLLRVIGALVEVGVVGVARTCLTCRFREQTAGTDRCALLQVDLPTADLRVNCPEHEARRPG